MLPHNFARGPITCRSFVQEERSHAIDAPGRVLSTPRKEMQYFLNAFKVEVLEKALLEGRRRIDAQFGAADCSQRCVAHLRAALRLILPEAGMPGTAIGASRARRASRATHNRDA